MPSGIESHGEVKDEKIVR